MLRTDKFYYSPVHRGLVRVSPTLGHVRVPPAFTTDFLRVQEKFIVWWMFHGYTPSVLDFADGDPNNCTIENLRPALRHKKIPVGLVDPVNPLVRYTVNTPLYSRQTSLRQVRGTRPTLLPCNHPSYGKPYSFRDLNHVLLPHALVDPDRVVYNRERNYLRLAHKRKPLPEIIELDGFAIPHASAVWWMDTLTLYPRIICKCRAPNRYPLEDMGTPKRFSELRVGLFDPYNPTVRYEAVNVKHRYRRTTFDLQPYHENDAIYDLPLPEYTL